MSQMLQRLKQRGRTSVLTSVPRATLAVFGKHPGWDDHMPDIGVVTQTLATLKQSLYVGGIGGQIDSGAWERLEPEKRIDGFDHVFLWTRHFQSVLGQLWSSKDRKGRSKYPMGACIHLESLSTAAALDKPSTLLEQVRDGCKSTTSGNHVVLACRAAQDQLDAWLNSSAPRSSHATLSLEQKRRFLEHPALQPDSVGWLRILHELDNATGRAHDRPAELNGATHLRPYHIRVPLCSDSVGEGLLLWVGFLRAALPASVPLLLIVRHQTDWLDVIIGEPGGEDLFCLQASPKALPLATAIPFDIAPDLRQRLDSIQAVFLGLEPAAPISKSATSSGGQTEAELDQRPGAHADGTRHRSAVPLVLGAVFLAVLCLAVGFWLRPKLAPIFSGHDGKTPDRSAASHPNNQAPAKDLTSGPDQQKQKTLDDLLAAGQEAARNGQWARATNVCGQALRLATELKDERKRQEAQRLLSHAQTMAVGESFRPAGKQEEVKPKNPEIPKEDPGRAAATELTQGSPQEESFALALKDAQVASEQHDYARATAAAEKALAIKPSDPEALRIKNSAQAEQKFRTLFLDAQAALNRADAATALTQADAALAIKADDPEATQIKQSATRQLAKAKAEKEQADLYLKAIQAAHASWEQKDYTQVVAQAEAALRVKANDSEANRLKANAQQEQAYEAATLKLNQADYDSALKLCQPYLTVTRFEGLSQQISQEQGQWRTVQQALNEGNYSSVLNTSFPDKPAFVRLKTQAVEERRVLQQAAQQLSTGDYGFMETLDRQGYKSKTPFVTLLKTGREERDILTLLQHSQNANEYQVVREGLAKLSPEVRSKKPFRELEQWAAHTPPKPSVPPTAAVGTSARMENVLTALEVRFGLREEDPAIVDSEGRPVKPEVKLSKAKRADAATKVRYLKEYRNDGWLTDERKVRLEKLDDTIRNWKE